MHVSQIFSVIVVFKLISFYVLGSMVVPPIFSVIVIFLSAGSVFVSLIWLYPTINETSRWLLRYGQKQNIAVEKRQTKI